LTLRLLADGRRRVAVVSNAYLLALEGGWPASKFPTVLRTLGEAGLQPAGGNVFRTAAEFGAWLERGGKKARGRGRPAANPVDAVLCEDDAVAARVVGEMASLGMRTPGDALVVGCDAWLMLPGTWSVRLEPDVVAGMAAGMLRKALETDGAVESLTYTPGLVTEAFQTEEDFQRLPRAEKLKT
jgi:DNA-binding LacI/PurR family transcriptional regulator